MFKLSVGMRYWVMFAIIATAVSGSMFLVVQQAVRMNANDPQIQLSEDAGIALAKGAMYSDIVLNRDIQSIDIEKSLAPFVIIYDESGKAVVGSGVLNGSYPMIPTGVFERAKINGENRSTWQPSTSTRVALVTRHFSGEKSGFVVSGRSMREIDKRINQQFLFIGMVWAILMILCFAFVSFKGFHIHEYHARRAEDQV